MFGSNKIVRRYNHNGPLSTLPLPFIRAICVQNLKTSISEHVEFGAS